MKTKKCRKEKDLKKKYEKRLYSNRNCCMTILLQSRLVQICHDFLPFDDAPMYNSKTTIATIILYTSWLHVCALYMQFLWEYFAFDFSTHTYSLPLLSLTFLLCVQLLCKSMLCPTNKSFIQAAVEI